MIRNLFHIVVKKAVELCINIVVVRLSLSTFKLIQSK